VVTVLLVVSVLTHLLLGGLQHLQLFMFLGSVQDQYAQLAHEKYGQKDLWDVVPCDSP
jgi:hypothetical protein